MSQVTVAVPKQSVQQVMPSISAGFVGVFVVFRVEVSKVLEVGVDAVGTTGEPCHSKVDAPSAIWPLDPSTSRGDSVLRGSCSVAVIGAVRVPGKVGDS